MLELSRRLQLRGLSTLVLARIAGAALQAATLFVLIKQLPIYEFGGYSAAIGLGAVVGGILGFGAATTALRIGDDPGGRSNSLISIALAGGAATSLIVAGYASIFTSASIVCVIAAAIFVFSESVSNVAQAILFGRKRPRVAEIFVVLRRAVPVTACLLAITSPKALLIVFSLGNALVLVIGVAISWVRGFSGGKLVDAISGGRHYWVASVGSMFQQLDVVVINAFMGSSASAIYAAAFRLASPVHIVTSSLVSLMLPRLTLESGRESRGAVGRRYLSLGIGYASLVIAASPVCFVLVPGAFGAGYGNYSGVFVLLFVNSAVSVINQVQASRLYGEDAASLVSKFTLGSTLTGLALVLFGAYFQSVITCAIGTVINQALLLALLSARLKRIMREQ